MISRMRVAALSAVWGLLLVLISAPLWAQTERQDYTSQLSKLIALIDNKQYREAIDGFRTLQAQPGTPAWLKAACEYEIAGLHATLQDTEKAITALSGAVQLGFDDCLTPRASERLRTILQNPKATQTLAEMKIAEGDFRELVWLQAEVQHARHDTRMMTIENINRVDHGATEIPQAQLPTRPTSSPGVLYWRQLLLLVQRMQREFVMKADVQRMRHAATMAAITGVSSSAVLESARKASAAAASRRLEIRRRAFVPAVSLSDRPKPCSEWNLAPPPPPGAKQ